MDGFAFGSTDQIITSRDGAHPWVLERRNGLTRGNYDRVAADDRSSGIRVLAEAQWRLNALISGGGY